MSGDPIAILGLLGGLVPGLIGGWLFGSRASIRLARLLLRWLKFYEKTRDGNDADAEILQSDTRQELGLERAT